MAFLRAFGCYLPPHVVTTDEIASRTGKNAGATLTTRQRSSTWLSLLRKTA